VTSQAVPSTFDGSAFHPEFPDGRAGGKIHVEAGRLRFEAQADTSQSAELPYPGLTMKLGGASDRLVFFSHPSLPEVSFYTSDHRILDHPHLASNADLAAQVAGVRGKKRVGQLVTASILAVIVLAVLGLIALKDPLVGFVADRVPPSVEVQLGDIFYGQIRTSVDIVEDKELTEELRTLVAPLLEAIPDTGYPFKFHLANDPTINAFAIPGGHVVVNSGLILKAESPEEVQGVLAHEIAHVTRRHSLRQVIGTAGLYVLVQTFFGDLTGLAAVVTDGGYRLLTLQFSRDAEREADDTGWDYLVAAHIDPQGMISFFEKLRDEQERLLGDAAGVEKSLAFLSTHPTSEERIELLTAKLTQSYPDSEPQTFDLAAFQEKIRQVAPRGPEGEEKEDGEPPSEESPSP